MFSPLWEDIFPLGPVLSLRERQFAFEVGENASPGALGASERREISIHGNRNHLPGRCFHLLKRRFSFSGRLLSLRQRRFCRRGRRKCRSQSAGTLRKRGNINPWKRKKTGPGGLWASPGGYFLLREACEPSPEATRAFVPSRVLFFGCGYAALCLCGSTP